MVIAVMWTITTALPVTKSSTWMQQFSTFCIVIIGLCCYENALVAYTQTKTGIPPKWLKAFINGSNIFSIIYKRSFIFFVDNCCDVCCICYGYFYPIPKRRKKRTRNNIQMDIEMNNRLQNDVENNPNDNDPVDSEAKNDITIDSKVAYDDDSDNEKDDRDDNNKIMNPIRAVDSRQQKEHQQQTLDSVKDMNGDDDNDNNNNKDEDSPLLVNDQDNELSWIRVGRAIDRISRVIIPIAFTIGVINLLAAAQY